MRPNKYIQLRRTSNCWTATFVGDEKVFAALGTSTIPTPFTEKADAQLVLETIEAKNPDHIVVIIK